MVACPLLSSGLVLAVVTAAVLWFSLELCYPMCLQSQSISWEAVGTLVYLCRVIRRQLPWKGS